MKKQYHHNVNADISITYILINKKLTLVAALGVMIGITIFIFLSCMGTGFVKKSNTAIFNNTPHIRIYKEDEISKPVFATSDSGALMLISNPMVVPKTDRIVNPTSVISILREQSTVTIVAPQISVRVFYNSGISQISGDASGVEILEADKMFNIKPTMVEGRMEDLLSIPNGILLGVDVALKMNVRTGDNITITSSRNVTKIFKVAGLFETHNSGIDKSQSYISINAAQQLLRESASYVTSIAVNVEDFNKAADYSGIFSALTGYKAEDWQEANSTLVSGFKMRSIMISTISLSILLIASFGMYNILNITISQKINDIAILKAMGFQSANVIWIFLYQGLLIGLIGMISGLSLATVLVYFTSKIHVGGDSGNFPIVFDTAIFIKGSVFGLVIILLASYMPARNAANVDPVTIFRK